MLQVTFCCLHSDLILDIKSECKQQNVTCNINQCNPLRISTPYIKGTSEKLNRILEPYSIQLSSKPSNTLRQKLCHLKDRRLVLEKKNALFIKFLANNVQEYNYVGETSRQLRTRVEEHKKAIIKKQPNSLIYQHSNETGHEIDFNNVNILENSKYLGPQLFMESLHTQLQNDTYNIKTLNAPNK